MGILPLLIIASLFANPASSAFSRADAGICPDAAPGQVEYVRSFFGAELTQPFREQYGLLGISPEDIRLLTDDRDAETCRRMAQAVRLDQTGPYPKIWRGFQAADFYIMMVTRELPPGVFYHGGGTGLIVLDTNFEIVAAAS